ncbi:hypothetical protein O1M63_31060 [Streptomyces mirabilis]|nr:hypothetical protein [Streptomyces mirabilis]
MAEFRRPPEWQQQADRHTTLIDPVLTVRPISRFDYTARRPVSAIDHALVFATAGGGYDAYMPRTGPAARTPRPAATPRSTRSTWAATRSSWNSNCPATTTRSRSAPPPI